MELFTWHLLLAVLTAFPLYSNAIKFHLQTYRNPSPKCIWNPVHDGDLVIVSAIVEDTDQTVSGGAGGSLAESGGVQKQRVDLEIIDSSERKNVYLSKKNVRGETRLAVTSHAEGEVGVCFRNWLDWSVGDKEGSTMTRIVDLDVDIGADAVDYNAIANQESLSGLETEMRKLEGQLTGLVEDIDYLKQREERFSLTNESINARVQNFAWLTIVALIVVGAWQIFHLRAFFKRKYLID